MSMPTIDIHDINAKREGWKMSNWGESFTKSVSIQCKLVLNNNKTLLPYSTCKMLHDELECSLVLTHTVPIYTIKWNMTNKI